jgi:hypothetical protein
MGQSEDAGIIRGRRRRSDLFRAEAVGHLQRVAPQVRAEIVPGVGHDLTFCTRADGQSKDP